MDNNRLTQQKDLLMKQQPLPKDREEFESRAILYHVLLDLEDFLLARQRFTDQYISSQKLKGEKQAVLLLMGTPKAASDSDKGADDEKK